MAWPNSLGTSGITAGRERDNGGFETLTLQQQADRLREWRDGFQAVYVIATGVQIGTSISWPLIRRG